MINKPLESITLADLESLKDNVVPEGKTLEYKRDLPSESPDEKRKMLRAICSLANTAGGDLIYGIEAKDGIPIDLPGVDSTNEDSLWLRIESSSRDGIQPRLSQLHLKFVPVSEGRAVLIIRVQKSWNAPHRLGQDGHFYGRNSAGGYQLDVGELRQAFTLPESVIDRIRAFRAKRLIKLEANSGPVALEDGLKMIFHMIPFSAFASSPPQRIELTNLQRMSFEPIGSSGSSGGVNLDGYYRYYGKSQDQAKTYAQVFRNGVVESVASFGPIQQMADRPIPSKYIETQLIRVTNIYRDALSTAGIEAPYFFFLSFLGVKDSKLLSGGNVFPETARLTERGTDSLILPETVAEAVGFDTAQTLKPLFDSYWNAYGYDGSQNYDESGQWIKGSEG